MFFLNEGPEGPQTRWRMMVKEGPQVRREESQDPLPRDSVAGKAAEDGTTVGRDAREGKPSGDRRQTRKREDRTEGLLLEVERQNVMDRVDPRWMRLEELNAEAPRPRKGGR